MDDERRMKLAAQIDKGQKAVVVLEAFDSFCDDEKSNILKSMGSTLLKSNELVYINAKVCILEKFRSILCSAIQIMKTAEIELKEEE
jgi:hypothetical protein